MYKILDNNQVIKVTSEDTQVSYDADGKEIVTDVVVEQPIGMLNEVRDADGTNRWFKFDLEKGEYVLDSENKAPLPATIKVLTQEELTKRNYDMLTQLMISGLSMQQPK